MRPKFDGPQELAVDEAIWKLVNASSPPSAPRGLVWYEVARALYSEVLRLRAESAGESPQLPEEERIAAFNAHVTPAPNYTICSVTSKRSYASERAALEASKSLPHKLRTYRCDMCRGWHVTKEHHG